MIEGVVEWWQESLGYGAAIMEDGRSVFLHKANVIGAIPKFGQVVEFDLYERESSSRLIGLNIKIKERA